MRINDGNMKPGKQRRFPRFSNKPCLPVKEALFENHSVCRAETTVKQPPEDEGHSC